MFTGDYQEYAKRFNKQTHVISGLIIYDTSQPVPQDIILVPCEAKAGQDLPALVKEVLVDQKPEGIFTYFQNIRWIVPDLEEQLRNWSYVEARSIDGYFYKMPLRISYGKITFDNSNADLEEDEDETGVFSLQVLGEQVTMKVTEFPKAVGVAKFFEKVNK